MANEPLNRSADRPSRHRAILLAAGVTAAVVLVGLFIASRSPLRWYLPWIDPVLITRGPFVQNVQLDRVTLCWRGNGEPGNYTVALLDRNGQLTRQIAVDSSALSPTPPPEGRQFELVIDGLEPGRHYPYRISPPGRGQDIEGTFRTAPAPGKPVEFTIWGDSRKHADRCQRIADLALVTGATITLNSGDFVTRGCNRWEWDQMLFEPAGRLMRHVAMYPALGNHDLGVDLDGTTGRQVYTENFCLPGREVYYSFDYGDVHFLVLDSNDDAWADDAQFEFAAVDLAATRAAWKVVMLHHPFYNSGHHGSHVKMRRQYAPLFARHNVDLIVTGHDHNYQRARPIVHRYESEQKRPYLHLVSGGGGAPTYTDVRGDELWSDHTYSGNHFVQVRIVGEQLEAQTINIDNEVVDSFEVDRSEPPAQPVAYELIELQEQYRQLLPCDPLGQPLMAILLEPEQTRGSITYRLANPLPESIAVVFAPPTIGGQTMTASERTLSLPANHATAVSFGFEASDDGKLLDLHGMHIELQTPVGTCSADTPPPPVAYRRQFVVEQGRDPIAVDGNATEPTWLAAPALGGLSSAGGSPLILEPNELQSEIKLRRHGEMLYVLVVTRWPLGHLPQLSVDLASSDHVIVFLASKERSVMAKVDASGRTACESSPTSSDFSVESATAREESIVTWEIGLPLTAAGIIPGETERVLVNVLFSRRDTIWALSPTFGQPPTRDNCGYLRVP